MVRLLVAALMITGACAAEESVDGRDDSFAGPKADGFCAEPGSVHAEAVLAVVNDPSMSKERLDDEVKLDKRAAEGIVEARPFASLEELDAVPYVGVNACTKILEYGCDVAGLCSGEACSGETFAAMPPASGFAAECESVLAALATAPELEHSQVEVDAQSRCAKLPRPARVAFDLAVSSRGVTPTDLGEVTPVDVRTYELAGRSAALVQVGDEGAGTLTRVLTVGAEPMAMWTSDGGVLYFGCGDEPAQSPDPEPACVAGILSGGCDADGSSFRQLSSTVEAGLADESPMVAAAIGVYAQRFAVALGVAIFVDISTCADENRAVAEIGAEDLPPALYSLVTDAEGAVWLATTYDTIADSALSCTRIP